MENTLRIKSAHAHARRVRAALGDGGAAPGDVGIAGATCDGVGGTTTAGADDGDVGVGAAATGTAERAGERGRASGAGIVGALSIGGRHRARGAKTPW